MTTKSFLKHFTYSLASEIFERGMIANSQVESVNACLKHLIYSSNTSLYDLMIEIHRLLDMQDQREQYTFWKLFFTPIMLQRQYDEINQAAVYYVATVIQDDQKKLIENFYGNDPAEIHDISAIWVIIVGNSTTVKHYVVLLKNNPHICICLFTIQQGIYFKDLDGIKKPFISADKFYKENVEQDELTIHINYLSAFDQDNYDFLEESSSKQDKISTNKRIVTNFNEDTNKQSEQSDDNKSDKKNHVVALQNPIKRHEKGHSLGTKRFKSFHKNKNKEK
ncbi:hypothetical protein RhiirA4_546793 [Rhizophagus irregularis]|uniref:MULE transposase domain-containing protein n=1 Tax=Rhizophagus irregularis TaxID=588596 RepID=A0A2I1GZ79_9GLOM|nr:hypothetical protein RhiirA4_546793 [Rhizophagus irregularis]